MKKIFVISAILFGSICMAQTGDVKNNPPKNNILVGMFNDGTYYSIGYEHMFTSKKHPEFTHAVGFFAGESEEFRLCLFGPCSSPAEKYYTVNFRYSLNVGTRRSRFEIGSSAGGIGKAVGVTVLMGYRFIPLRKNNLSFRVTASYPLFVTNTPKILYMPLGASLGFSF